MKKFMTDIKTMAALLIAGAAFTACSSSDDNIIDEQPVNPAQKTYTLTVNASKGDGATTRALDLTGKTLTASWATTENVYVKKGETWATGSLQPEADGTTATLKGSLTGITIAADDNLTLQFPKSGAITYAGQLGTLADIQANFDWATATVEVESVSPSGNINPKAATTTFTNQQAIIKFTLKDKANDAAISPSALTVTDGTSTVSLTSIPATTYTANGEGVLYVAFPAAGSAKTITLTATVGSDTYTYTTSSAKTFVNGQYYNITVKMTQAAFTPSAFTINGNSTNNQVYFSPGNLQYQGSTAKFRFAGHQYDYVGNAAGNTAPSATQTAWIDLFGWGTSGYNNKYPYMTNTTSTDYGDGNNSIADTNYDWGVYNKQSNQNKIENGGNYAWRTLTTDEWVYLFNTRTSGATVGSTNNARYTMVKILTDGTGTEGLTKNICGVILFPDGVTFANTEATWGTINGTSNWDTQCTSAQWAALEAKGCVFLPAAGSRNGSSVNYAGSYGYYWSSSLSPYGANYANGVNFWSGNLNPQYYNRRYYGYSVRLVRPVE